MAIVDTDTDFDTLAHVRTLREAGVEGKQAEAHAEAARALRAGLATKADLDSLEMRLDARLDARIADLRADMADLRADMASLRADIYRALWVQGAGLVAVMTALIAAFRLFG